MKKSIIAVGLLALAMVSQDASAKTLEDVLKEKGVITEEDYKEIVKSKPSFDYKLGKGFTFTSPNEKFQLTLGGRLQFRYTFTDFDDYYTLNSTTKVYAKKSDTSQWDAKRIRLIAQGYAYVGTVDTVLRGMEAQQKRQPVDWVFCYTYNSLIPHPILMKSIETFWTKVMPRFR